MTSTLSSNTRLITEERSEKKIPTRKLTAIGQQGQVKKSATTGVSKREKEEWRERRHGASLRIEGDGKEEEEEETLAAREDQA